MEIKYFRLIKAIVEEGNIANSTKKLFLTQSALSHQLRGLEENLGFKVFYRERNKWTLTEEGREFYNLSKTVLEQIDTGMHNIHLIQEGTAGTIRISTECYSFYNDLPSFVQKMAILYPEIEIDMVLDATRNQIAKLLQGEIDMAIVTTDPKEPELGSIEIYRDEVFALMHHENPLEQKAYVEPSDFLSAHLIIHSYPLETVSVYEHFLRPQKILPSKISAIPLTEVSLQMVDSNMGITCMPKWALKSYNVPENIIFKPLGKNGLKRKHRLLFRKSDANKKYICDFISNFKEEFSHG